MRVGVMGSQCAGRSNGVSVYSSSNGVPVCRKEYQLRGPSVQVGGTVS